MADMFWFHLDISMLVAGRWPFTCVPGMDVSLSTTEEGVHGQMASSWCRNGVTHWWDSMVLMDGTGFGHVVEDLTWTFSPLLR